ncbi:hypothetical protein ACFVQ4_01480 [Streptomyces laurentii]|uniref:hypothetical protein n=1 Tax=Streptomyces laurentii TaxID=39478 RepID=UPI0036BD84C6
MPFAPEDIRVDLTCGIGPDGHWRGWFHVHVHPDALRRLGLHPDQATAVTSSSPPAWWHADAERRARR